MSREIKFRQWDGEEMNFWGFKYSERRNSFGFKSPFSPAMERYPVMQYTGLKDKNGKEIYEGDIAIKEVCWESYSTEDGEHYKITGEVRIIPSKGACIVNGVKVDQYTDEVSSHQWYTNVVACRSEVIGNIYENPELLESDHE